MKFWVSKWGLVNLIDVNKLKIQDLFHYYNEHVKYLNKMKQFREAEQQRIRQHKHR